jgi:hypothetical protein
MAWPGSLEELQASFHAMVPHYGHRLTAQVLAGAALAGAEATPAWAISWCVARIDLAELGISFDWETALSLRWTPAPLPLAIGGAARLAWCLVGLAPADIHVSPFPLWWERVVDDQARQVVENVLAVLDERWSIQVALWPFLADIGDLRLRGPSLGLPLYLAAWGMHRGLKPRGLLATGGLDATGGLQPVEHLDLKGRLATDAGFHALICPAGGKTVPEESVGVEVLEVMDLSQAELLWEIGSPGCCRHLLQQVCCLDDPAWMAANVHLLGSELLRWPSVGARCRQAVRSLLSDRALTLQWTANLERMVDEADTCLESMERLLDPLSLDIVADLAARYPLDGFRLAQVRVSCANHRGLPERAREWAALSERMGPSLQLYEGALQLEEIAANRRFVCERHNRYEFRLELPRDVERVLAELSELQASRTRTQPQATCTPLGRLLGTVAQNFGFCGPEYLDDARDSVDRARRALGRGRVGEYYQDWQRQFCYEAYAFLDAHRYDDAEGVLSSYLGGSPFELTMERVRALNPYQHAALARFLRETGTRTFSTYLRWAREERCRARSDRHPWQLWLLNAGFLMATPEEKLSVWTKAVECCLAQGATVQVMALMPLCELWTAGLGAEDWIRDRTMHVMTVLRSSDLNLHHFQCVLEKADWQDVLRTVHAHRNRLFPFSYR